MAANKILGIRLTPDEDADLRAAAAARGLPAGDLVRGLIREARLGAPAESIVDALEAMNARGDPEEIEAAAEIVGEGLAKLREARHPAPPLVEIIRMRHAG